MKLKILLQLLRMTRLAIYGMLVQITLSSMLLAEDSKAQMVSLDEIHVELQFSEAKIENVFAEIEAQTQLNFTYLQKELRDASRITLSDNNISLAEALLKVSAQSNLKFRRINENIHVSRIKKSEKETKVITDYFQSIIVSGKVTSDESPEGLPGVNIIIKGTTQGTVTDINGNYSLEVPSSESVIIFSSVGFLSEEVIVRDRSIIDMELIPDITALGEIVVIGYGTQRKGEITSSIASVDEREFNKGNVTDAGQLIQGKVAGLTVVSPSGDPTGTTQILLRGNTTLVGASMNPLVLIDGVPGDLRTVAPQDIESIDVLKDGSAAAIYGTRGTNGVILITTRRASGNYESAVEYSGFASIQSIARKLNLSSASDFRQQITDGYRDANTDLRADTDWLDEISHQPVSHVHNLTFRGGNPTTNYLLNVNYNSSEGVFLKSFNKALSGRADINHNMFDDKLRLNFNILSSTRKLNGFNGYNYRQSIIQNPTAPVKDENGNWFQELTKFEYENPVSNLYESDGLAEEHLTRFNNTIILEPIEGLRLTSLLSYSKWNRSAGYSETKQHISTLRDSRNGYASINGAASADRLAELTAEFTRRLEKHQFKLLAGYSYQDNTYSSLSMENWNFPTDQFGYHNIGLGEATKNGDVTNPQTSYHEKTNLIGFFGRLTYNYEDKYLLMASLRREAASQLWGTKDPWGTFPAVSVGWRLTNESFLADQRLFNDIKLRAGYGVTGTRPSNPFGGVGLVGYDQYVLVNGIWVRTLIPTQNPNFDLRWEEKHETNFGVDFSLLKNRISGSIDYYIRKIDGLLFDYAVPSPPNLYTTTRANVGEMENKGLEILLNFIPVQSGNIEWTTTATFSTNSNKLSSLSNDIYQASSDYFTTGYTGPPVQTFTHLVKVGDPIGNFYGFKVVDIGNDPNDEANYGQWIYEGENGELISYSDFGHSFEDKKVLGNGLPKYYASWINNFHYKNWDLSITQRGAFKFQVANFQRMMYENPTFNQYNLLESAFDPVYGKTQLRSPHEFNSYYIEDGDYWKIDNITLGYNIPSTKIKFIKSARIYVSSLNTFIITGYKGIDPEVSLVTEGGASQSGININSGAGLSPGIDQRDKYPTMRTFTAGVNVTF